MTEYLTDFMNWVDTSGPLVRVPFVVGLILLYMLIYRFIKKITNRLSSKITNEKKVALKIQNQIIVSDKDMTKIIVSLIKAGGLIVALMIGVSVLNMAMGLFEWSRSLASELLALILSAVGFVVQQVIDYIPSLMVIVVVLLAVRFLLHVLIRRLFKA